MSSILPVTPPVAKSQKIRQKCEFFGLFWKKNDMSPPPHLDLSSPCHRQKFLSSPVIGQENSGTAKKLISNKKKSVIAVIGQEM